MTRDFNNHWRNDRRQSFRKTSSNINGEERSSRSTRPRLSREVVDRAWEQGSQTHHPDYQPRYNNNGPFAQNNQNGRRSGKNPASKHPVSHRDNRKRTEQAPYNNQYSRDNNQYPRARSNETNRRNYQAQRSTSYPVQNEGQSTRKGTRAPQGESWRFIPEYNGRNAHYTENEGRANGTRHPYRQQTTNRDRYPRSPRKPVSKHQYEGQYEGDYEQFTGYNDVPASETGNYPRRQQQAAKEPRNRHVTHLPDGRVLKGPRPVQRRNARFWNEVAEDTQDLLQHVQEPKPDKKSQSDTVPQQTRNASRQQRPASKKNVHKQSEIQKARKEPEQSRSNVPRPSQRGFKWPSN